MTATMRSICAALLLAAVSTSAPASCDSGETVIKLGYAADDPASVPARFSGALQTAINKELQGRACLQALNFPTQYGGDRDLSALSADRLQLALPTLAEMGARVSGYRVFNIPFAFRDYPAVERFLSVPAYRGIAEQAGQNGLQPLGLLHGALWQVAASKPVLEPADLSGMRVRENAADGIGEIARAVNATAQPIKPGQLEAALREGAVGVVSGDWVSLNKLQAARALSAMVQTNHAYRGYAVVASPKWWGALDEKRRTDILATIDRTARQINDATIAADAAARSEIIARGTPVYEMTRMQRRKWQDALFSLRGRFEDPLSTALKRANADP